MTQRTLQPPRQHRIEGQPRTAESRRTSHRRWFFTPDHIPKHVDLVTVECRGCGGLLGRVPFRNWQLFMDGCPRQCPACGRPLAPTLNAVLKEVPAHG